MNKNVKSCISLFNVITGSALRLREIHFNTAIQAQHNLTNDVMPALTDYSDSVMEQCMGMFGRPGMNIINPVISSKSDIKEVLTELRNTVISFRKGICDNHTFAGMCTIVDDLIADINKWIYLSENK